jgi:hypothetical protein
VERGGNRMCQGEACTNKAVRGSSYCSEEHLDQLMAERRAKNAYRVATPVSAGSATETSIVPHRDYTASLPRANNPIDKSGRGRGRPRKVQAPASNFKATLTPIVQRPTEKDQFQGVIAALETQAQRLEAQAAQCRKAAETIREQCQ